MMFVFTCIHSTKMKEHKKHLVQHSVHYVNMPFNYCWFFFLSKNYILYAIYIYNAIICYQVFNESVVSLFLLAYKALDIGS